MKMPWRVDNVLGYSIVPLAPLYRIILSSQAHRSFNFDLISKNLVSISKLKLFLWNELKFVALPFILAELCFSLFWDTWYLTWKHKIFSIPAFKGPKMILSSTFHFSLEHLGSRSAPSKQMSLSFLFFSTSSVEIPHRHAVSVQVVFFAPGELLLDPWIKNFQQWTFSGIRHWSINRHGRQKLGVCAWQVIRFEFSHTEDLVSTFLVGVKDHMQISFFSSEMAAAKLVAVCAFLNLCILKQAIDDSVLLTTNDQQLNNFIVSYLVFPSGKDWF